jgi:branched-chain amino acid transport system ATP-binding protein
MLLEVSDLSAGYGEKTVIRGVSLNVAEREVVAVLGHNGAGKSTLMSAIYGAIRPTKGRIVFQGIDITRANPASNLGRGIGYSPQGAPVFATLTVTDNLMLAGFPARDQKAVAQAVDRIQQMFPALKARRGIRAGALSGGERQQLALGMLFVAAPRLVMLDEPSGGLSPAIVDRVYANIKDIAQSLDASVLIVEQDVNQALRIANRVYVLANGQQRFAGSPHDLDAESLRKLVLGF